MKILMLLAILFGVSKSHADFTDITSMVLGSDDFGAIAAFGDFNADKHVDIFVITNRGKQVKLLLSHQSEAPYISQNLIGPTAGNLTDTIITNVVPADFNGDVQMDILLCRQKANDKSAPFYAEIYWGNGRFVDQDNPTLLSEQLLDHPLVMDSNADMIADLFGESLDGKRKFWIGSKDKNFTTQLIKGEDPVLPPLRKPQSSAFVDVNSDFCSDLSVMSVKDGRTQIEQWFCEDGAFVLNRTLIVPESALVIGQATFVNIDGDNFIDVVLPVCEDQHCAKSKIYVFSKDMWHKLPVTFGKGNWRFVEPSQSINKMIAPPITLRAGDYNLDGYPDLLAILSNQNHTQQAFLLKNIPFNSDNYTRSFEIIWPATFTHLTDSALLTAFFDVDENGILDVLLTSHSKDDRTRIHVFKNKFLEDAYFLKVMVVSGLCETNCNVEPYGVNQPGPVIRFKTTQSTGEIQLGYASQLTQSAHYSLQLPFTVFGLGQTPNYIDTLEVGIPYSTKENSKIREWTSIIPNSQLIIIPYLSLDPYSWKNRLFVTPSRLVLLTGAALLGTCAVIAAVVGILHWRERAEDKREKLQEAHKFHFDAM